MSEMVERVRNAIDEALAEIGAGFPYPRERLDPVARAAIEAMREPTPAMCFAMMNTQDDGGGELHRRKWQAAITQALQENPDNG